MPLRSQIKSVLSPMVRAAWPVVETIGELEARVRRGPLEVCWSVEWTPEFDRALDELPPLPNCSHDLYRELVKPTRVQKKHALVLERGKPIAIVSLRLCGRHWEPVTYQCLPGTIAPALDTVALVRALNALGMEVRVPAGLRGDINALHPSRYWTYDWFSIDVEGDYEAHWRARKRMKRIRKVIDQTASLQRRVNVAGDLEWTIEQWREQWKDDPSQEVAAADDRLNFWGAMTREPGPIEVVTLMLADGERRAAGFVMLRMGDVATSQCSSRDPHYYDAGNASYLFAVDWAKANGVRALDLGGGPYKFDWAPVAGQRYGAVFRPGVMSAFSWARAH